MEEKELWDRVLTLGEIKQDLERKIGYMEREISRLALDAKLYLDRKEPNTSAARERISRILEISDRNTIPCDDCGLVGTHNPDIEH